jgi:hypothetical protein
LNTALLLCSLRLSLLRLLFLSLLALRPTKELFDLAAQRFFKRGRVAGCVSGSASGLGEPLGRLDRLLPWRRLPLFLLQVPDQMRNAVQNYEDNRHESA